MPYFHTKRTWQSGSAACVLADSIGSFCSKVFHPADQRRAHADAIPFLSQNTAGNSRQKLLCSGTVHALGTKVIVPGHFCSLWHPGHARRVIGSANAFVSNRRNRRQAEYNPVTQSLLHASSKSRRDCRVSSLSEVIRAGQSLCALHCRGCIQLPAGMHPLPTASTPSCEQT